MAKQRTIFYCQNCGAQSPKWIGKCSSCGEWNTYLEEVLEKDPESKEWKKQSETHQSKPVPVSEISGEHTLRIDMKYNELNRVFGGGLVPGSLVLIGGEPGIGKSTLMLQLALKLENFRVVYVSGEESEQQLKMRADRLQLDNPECYILTETNTQAIIQHLEELKPSLVIIDSVQTIYTTRIESSAGSISQIRESAAELQRFAKHTNTPVILIGHITKDGFIAGPKVLEHMVDTVLQFEGDNKHVFRIIRAIKNRFGPTSELGIFEMKGNGLEEVINPSDILITHHDDSPGGVAIASIMEGLRPLMIETQALVSSAAFGTPQRSSTGFDLRRLNMLLAVLEKRLGFKLSTRDVFLNIAGGIRVDDPATDLGVVMSIISSAHDLPVHNKYCFSAEVGLTGEIRPVGRIEQRISEAGKLGFKKIFISKLNMKGISTDNYNIEIEGVTSLTDLFSRVFGKK